MKRLLCYDNGMYRIIGLDIRKLTGQGLFEHYLETLSMERKKRILRIKSIPEQYRSLGAGLLLEYGLQQAGVSEQNRELSAGIHGKPYLVKNAGICFNLSHAGDYVVAIFADREVGIDMERCRILRDGVIKRTCCKTEAEWLSEQKNAEQSFVRVWTAKESYVKWSGEGLTCPLTELELIRCKSTTGDRFVGVKRSGREEAVLLQEYAAPGGYGICVCVSADEKADRQEERGWPEGISWLELSDLRQEKGRKQNAQL